MNLSIEEEVDFSNPEKGEIRASQGLKIDSSENTKKKEVKIPSP